MSLNFPTAFWKTNSPEGIEIDWQTRLWWTHYTGEGSNMISPPNNVSSFPFIVSSEEFHPSYPTATTFDSSTTDPYYGWFLHGNTEYDLSNYHRANPWIIEENGQELSIYYEADYDTALASGAEGGIESSIMQKYNAFIQSGDATGSFTLNSTKNLEIKVSGLAHDAYATSTLACHYNSMLLYLYNGSSEELICSGCAPGEELFAETSYPLHNEENLEGNAPGNIDMQQVKLYAGSNLNTIVNFQKTPAVNTARSEPRSTSGEWVDQLSRHSYCNANGVGTFNKTNLAAGDYQLRVKSFSADGSLQSGAFYGFKFTFS